MSDQGLKSPTATLESLGIKNYTTAYWNLSPSELTEHALAKGQGKLTNAGALAVNTGTFTGRSPKDKFTVKIPLLKTL